ncbi:MAG: hypothetical protein ISP90_17180 [Nevskia sp.]|nr:hypothetical protein [Nevskia sp.]
MYETHRNRPLTRRAFARRLARHALFAGALIALSLAVGMAGYSGFEHLAWHDAFLNSAMLLGGMGPVDAPKSDAGKLFAGFYALYAGLVFIVVTAIMLAPVMHRLLHLFHFEGKS